MPAIDNTTKALLRDPLKRRAWVIYQCGITGRTLADVAREYGVSRQCIYSALVRPYPRMEHLIAQALGMSPQVLFPERYGADGLPSRRMGRPPFKVPRNVSCHDHTSKHKRTAAKRNTQAVANA